MVESRARQPERRQDRRIPIRARVRIAPREGPGFVTAELVDVSAGGLRARTPPPMRHPAGTEVEVEIRVQGDVEIQPLPETSLRGLAVIVRVQEAPGGTGLDAAMRFKRPLEMREAFDKLLVL